MTISHGLGKTVRLAPANGGAAIARPGLIGTLHRFALSFRRDELPTALVDDVDPNRVARPPRDLDARIRPHLY